MSEADKIYVEVERRKKRAQELGLPKIVFDFYHKLAQWYPAWAEFPDHIPRSVSDVQQGRKRGVEFTLGKDRYTFAWSERSGSVPDGDVYWSGELELLENEKRVFQIRVHGSSDEVTGVYWTPSEVAAFVEGPWVKAISALAVEAKRAHEDALEQAELRKKEDPNKLAELKERFGIESVEPTKDEPERRDKPGREEWVFVDPPNTSWWKRLLGL
jgi:hypothetical protein